MTLSVVKHATCAGCGCVCDDIELHAERDRIVRADHACELGRAWFFNHTAEAREPAALINGQSVTVDSAVTTAARLLRDAQLPLVFGLGTSTIQAQREAVLLAETVAGVIDSHTSLTHGPTKIGGQLVGKVAATLGEVRNRADFIMYWGSNPEESHPRHFSKYTFAPGKFTPHGRADRTIVFVDVRETPSTKAADVFLQLRPNNDFEVLTALRAILRNQPVNEEAVAASGLSVQQLRDLGERMKRARYGAIFFGTGLTATRGKHMNAAAIHQLTADLNAFTKFIVIPMRDHGNEAGIDHVLCWTTGYPMGVDFSRGFPRSNPGEFTAVDLLIRKEVDAAIIVGDGPWTMMPQRAVDYLASIPTIVIDSRVTSLSRLACIHITAAVTGISAPGTVYRMDKVPLPVRPALVSPYPTEEELLARICEAATEPSTGRAVQR